MFLPVVEPENLIANFLLCNFCFQLIRHLMHMSLEKTTLLESLCFRSGGVWTLKLKIMLWWFLNLVVDLKLLFQSKISVISCHLIFGLCVLCNICICCIQIFLWVFAFFFPSLYRGKVGLDVAEAQHLFDGLDWQGAVKDINASVNWLKANGSKKVCSCSCIVKIKNWFLLNRPLNYTATFLYVDLCLKIHSVISFYCHSVIVWLQKVFLFYQPMNMKA